MSYPVPGGKIIGRPNQGSHRPGAGGLPGNWQSDNAVDIAVPVGTPVYAVSSGVIGPNIGPFSSSNPVLAGQRLTVQMSGGDAAYYAHLSRIVVHAGQRVHAGELLGYSGSANGVAHLHFAVESGTPFKWLAGLPAMIAKGAGLGPSGPTSANSSGPGVPSDAPAGQAMGCASTIAALALGILSALALYYSGAPSWP
jgi:murein DD-endopeptidase MepM/ murein hydrolase activator NlpD